MLSTFERLFKAEVLDCSPYFRLIKQMCSIMKNVCEYNKTAEHTCVFTLTWEDDLPYFKIQNKRTFSLWVTNRKLLMSWICRWRSHSVQLQQLITLTSRNSVIHSGQISHLKPCIEVSIREYDLRLHLAKRYWNSDAKFLFDALLSQCMYVKEALN